MAQNHRQTSSAQQYAQVPSAAEQGVQISALWLGGLLTRGLPILIPLSSPLNVPTLCCEVGIVPVLALIARSATVSDTDLETVCPKIAYGFPGFVCGFTVVDSTTTPSPSASPLVEVGDDGKEPVDIGVTRRKGGREGRVGDDKPLNSVVLLDGSVC